MGANEKHAATYHGRGYTPDTEIMRFLFKIGRLTRNKNVGGEQMDDEFARWLETVRAEAKAEALEEAADDIVVQFGNETVMGFPDPDEVEFPTWLRNRANQYKENQS